MKKLLLLSVISILASAVAVAQETFKSGLGVKVDVGYAAITSSANGYSDTAGGLCFGATLTWDMIVSQNQPMYIGVGAGYRHSTLKSDDNDISGKANIDQVNVDLYFGRDAITGKRFGAKVGIRANIPVSVKSEAMGEKTDVLDLCNPVQVGMIVFPYWKINKFEVGIDMSLMFSNFFKKEDLYSEVTSPYVSVGVNFGYRF